MLMTNNMIRKRLSRSDITLGKAIPWPIYNIDGMLYFKAGFIFHTAESLEHIADIELYYKLPGELSVDAGITAANDPSLDNDRHDAVAASPVQIYPIIDECIHHMDIVHEKFLIQDRSFIDEIKFLVERIRKIYEQDPDRCIGAVHLYRRFPLKKLKPVLLALLCEIQAAPLNLTPQNRQSLLAAALTSGMADIDKAYRAWSSGEMFRQDLMLISTDTIKILVKLGVDDPLWFDVLMQNNGDNTGIIEEAAILRVARNYLYQILLGKDGKPLKTKEALQHIYKQAETQNEQVYLGFIKDLGVYPPGSVVSLKNGETGIVTRKSKMRVLNFEVAVLCMANGHDHPLPVYRYTCQPGCEVANVLEHGELLIANPELLWLNKFSKRDF